LYFKLISTRFFNGFEAITEKEISRNWKIGKAQFLCIIRLFAQVLWFFIGNY